MIERRLYCDRCGNEITDAGQRYTLQMGTPGSIPLFDSRGLYNRQHDQCVNKDLCEDCHAKLMGWLEILGNDL